MSLLRGRCARFPSSLWRYRVPMVKESPRYFNTAWVAASHASWDYRPAGVSARSVFHPVWSTDTGGFEMIRDQIALLILGDAERLVIGFNPSTRTISYDGESRSGYGSARHPRTPSRRAGCRSDRLSSAVLEDRTESGSRRWRATATRRGCRNSGSIGRFCRPSTPRLRMNSRRTAIRTER